MDSNKNPKALIEHLRNTMIDRGRCVPLFSKPEEGLEILKCSDGVYTLKAYNFSIVIEKKDKVEIPL